MRRSSALLAACLLLGAPAAAEDPAALSAVSGYVQAWSLGRAPGSVESGPLDNSGRPAGGWLLDGLFVRRFEIKLATPLGPSGLSLKLAVTNDLSKAGVGDAYLQWLPPVAGLRLQAGQMRLPFGAEQQGGSAGLITLDRALIFGFSNYGHVDAWGLGLLQERGDGLRVDYSPGAPTPSGEPEARWVLQAGAFATRAQGFDSLLGGGGRAAFKAGWPELGAEAGASVFVGHGRSGWQASSYSPLGQDPQRDPWVPVTDLGRPTLLTWGYDAALNAEPFHLSGEAAFQRGDAGLRGGGQLTAWLDIPATLAGCQFFVRVEQASNEWADGVHRPASLLRARSLGLRVGLPWRQSLTGERLELSGDDLRNGPTQGLWIAQWQAEF